MEWIAHRGLVADYPENTLPAFEAAVSAGYLTLETDLRVCRSGEIVLCHDESFARVGGNNVPVTQLTKQEIQKFKLDGHGIPPFFLEDFLEKFAGHEWVLDIKPETGAAVCGILINRFSRGSQKAWFENHASFVVWSPKDEQKIREAFPGSRVFMKPFDCYRAGIASLLRVPFWGGIRAGMWYSLTPELNGINLFSRRIVESYQERGAKVLAFLPRNETQLDRAIESGFDSILCDWRGPKSL